MCNRLRSSLAKHLVELFGETEQDFLTAFEFAQAITYLMGYKTSDERTLFVRQMVKQAKRPSSLGIFGKLRKRLKLSKSYFSIR